MEIFKPWFKTCHHTFQGKIAGGEINSKSFQTIIFLWE
ncbi:hypothetical protein ABOONEI_1981 [Aciduliprofundum boonei T469]|nr:hypothetical protein ABOONEI_1981 [Aciduliprofundum boonei T469]